MKILLNFLLLSCLFFRSSHATDVTNIDGNITSLGFDRFFSELRKDNNSEQVKIAIFDYGFDGYQKEQGYTIPKNTEIKVRPGDTNFRDPQDVNTHGLAMAQIITQYMTKNYNRWSLAPKIYLYKSDGYSNFEWAIEDAIKNGVNVVLHSIVIEYGSNYDGRGFYNSLVDRATNAGIVWVNAAGNFGLTTYNSKIAYNKDGWVEMRDLDHNALPITCEAAYCNIRLVLAWNDFKDKPMAGSNKDLDLYLFDKNFSHTIVSELTQVEYQDSRSGETGYSLYPREIIETKISKGVSYVMIKAKSHNFSRNDSLRITADGNNISFPIRDKQESLLNPADNPNVITVGEATDRSSVSQSLNKPELIAPSLVTDHGKSYMGSSNAAAAVAAGIGLMKKINPSLDREDILKLATRNGFGSGEILKYSSVERILNPQTTYSSHTVPAELNSSFVQSSEPVESADYGTVLVGQNPYAIPTKVLQFSAPAGFGCFPLADIKMVEPCVVANFIVKSHGLLVATTAGLKIATSYDPIELIPKDQRLDVRDAIAIFPVQGFPFRRVPRNIPLPRGAIEIFKLPVDEMICKLPDWNFLMAELEVSRRRLYEANASGAYNNYIPKSCTVDAIQNAVYNKSDWSMYPSLQHTPYVAPVGPAPRESRRTNDYNYGYGYPGDDNSPNQYQENFQLPDPSQVEN
jgi:hypothetical protein